MLQVNNLSKSYGTQCLFENVTFTVGNGERVGLVGRNGSGKSTLFKLIMNIETADSGNISIPKGQKLGYLDQHIKFKENSLIKECCEELQGEEEFDHYKAEKILFGLGFDEKDLEKSPQSFSGGFQLRIKLAKVLLSNPDLLLLDEPTNYLDIVSIRWLEKFLKSFKGQVIIITHDREFMDQVVTHVVGIYRKRVKKIKGNTEKFYEQLLQEEEIYEKTLKNQEKKKAHLMSFVDRFRAKASKAKQAQSRMKMVEKMGSMDSLENEDELGFYFHFDECPGKTILEAKEISFHYPNSNDLLVNSFSLPIGRKDRWAIIGKNGKGKSTLLNLLAQELDPTEGSISTHSNLKVGHFGQTNINRLNENLSIAEEISSSNPDLSLSQARGICGTMLFSGDAANKKIKVLSGGEKSRVTLGKILAHKTNLLLLDEPTNHLDMESIEALSGEIENYPGAIILVSHNELLLRRVANGLIIFQGGKIEIFKGSYDEFLEKIGWEDEEALKSEKQKVGLNRKELKKMRSDLIKERSKELNPLKKSLEEVENKIEKLENEISQYDQDMIDASETGDGKKISDISMRKQKSEQELENFFNQFEELSHKVEEGEAHYQEKLNELDEFN